MKSYEAIVQNCTPDGPHMVWKGRYSRHRNPIVSSKSVRRMVLAQKQPTPLRATTVAIAKCGVEGCVAWDCVAGRTKASVLKETMQDAGVEVRRTLGVTKAARARGKLNLEAVAQIHDQPERTLLDLASEFGVHYSLISAVRRGKSWKKPASNHWAGL